jgi:DNA-binding response OmpR family regulator
MIVIDALQVDAEVSSLCKYLQIVHPEARMVVLSDQHGPHAGYDHLRLHRCLQRPWTVDGLREAIMAPAAIKARVSSRLLVWDLQTRKLLIADRQIALTPREARLFDHLYRNEDRSVPAEELAEAIDLPVQNERIRLTAMIVSLRKKMGDHAVWIETDRHLGYRFSRQSVVIAR